MKFKIDDNFRVTSDTYNLFLEERKITKSGKNKGDERWERVGSWGSLDGVLKGYLEHRIKTSDVEGLENLVDTVNGIKSNINEVLDKLKEVE